MVDSESPGELALRLVLGLRIDMGDGVEAEGEREVGIADVVS